MKKVILILSTGHSGSTLLDFILSSAKDSFGVGEIHKIRKQKFRNGAIPFCSIHEEKCEFWSERRKKKVTNYLFLSRFKRVFYFLRKSRYSLYKYVLSESDSKILVDSSKYPEWVEESVNQLRGTKIQPYIIFLNRDVRAVINSWVRKYPESDLNKIILEQKTNLYKITKLYNNERSLKLKVNYEDLTSDPIQEFKRIFDFIGEDFCSDYLEYWKYEHHHIGGNSGTKSLIKKYQGNLEETDLRNHNKSYYQDHKFEIRRDERWKTELSPEIRQLIEKEFSLNEDQLSS